MKTTAPHFDSLRTAIKSGQIKVLWAWILTKSNKQFMKDNKQRMDSVGYVTPENRSGKDHALDLVGAFVDLRYLEVLEDFHDLVVGLVM
jgi:hypothetical protein